MSKRKKGSHGVYDLTCISYKCRRRFKVLYEVRRVSRAEQIEKMSPQANTYNVWGYTQFTYPFTGCPFCGAWWCTGPLDGEAYPKRELKSWVSEVGNWSHISTNKGLLHYQSLVSAGLRGLGFKSWAN